MIDDRTLYDIAKSCGGVVTTDSRDCPAGSLFVALRGATFDGNAYAAAALEAGCAHAIVDGPTAVTDSRMTLVEDSLKALKAIAREHRRALATHIIAITGTNGKTTTKELTAAVLAKRYRTLSTAGNYNNDIGVPKTLLRLTAEDEIAVVEMGASHPGDIRTLAETAEPNAGLITNVGRAHLAGFGSAEGVLHTKGELYDYLRTRADSVAFINPSDEALKSIATGLPRVVEYARGEIVACDPFLTIATDGMTIRTHLVGVYNMQNVMAAVTVGRYYGIADGDIREAIESYCPTNSRSQLKRTERNTLIIDAYNANPTSMAAALETFGAIGGRQLAILGQMGELGKDSDAEHAQVVVTLQAAGIEAWLVGEEFAKQQSPFRTFNDIEDVKAAIAAEPLEGYTILIKGSHSTRLYELPPYL